MRRTGKNPILLAIGATITLAGCSSKAPESGQSSNKALTNTATAAGNAAAPNAATNSSAPAATAQALTAKVDGFEFSYKWPAAAAAIPALDSWLRGNGEKIRKENQSGAMDQKAEAKKDGYPFHDYSYDEDYAVVANTPRMLVLLSNGYVYTGGAHGMPINTAIIWDKGAGKRIGTESLIPLPRLATVAKTRFCDALDKERAKRRGEPVRHDDPDQLSDFVDCVDMTKQLILPASKDGKALDTMRVVIGPYEAGPYAEGSYIIDLPMDAALLATVNTPYRDAFVAAQ
jgi:hypothetical protein